MNRKGVEKVFQELRARTKPSPLVPKGVWNKALDREIERLLDGATSDDERCVMSALHLWNDNLERSHEVSQEIHTVTGSCLHGVMHRREPDYGNSKYWFRKVDDHEVFPAVRTAALGLLGAEGSKELQSIRKAVESSPAWDGFRMVDWCQASDRGKMPADVTGFLEALQFREIAILADFCLDRAKS